MENIRKKSGALLIMLVMILSLIVGLFACSPRPVVVDKPTINGELIYSAVEQSANIAVSDYYTVSDNIQTSIGEYSATITLVDKARSIWDSGDTDDFVLDWSINIDSGLVLTLAYGEYSVTNYTASTPFVAIPSVYNGVPVTSIGDSAFTDCLLLTSIHIPESVIAIGDGAFSHCMSLSNIVIPQSVTSIGDVAFSNCINLQNIVIPHGVSSIGEYTFLECSSLDSIIIPDSVTTIGDGAFIGCTSLSNIIIPEGLTSIGNYAFIECRSIESIVIPNSVTSIGNNIFFGCDKIALNWQ